MPTKKKRPNYLLHRIAFSLGIDSNSRTLFSLFIVNALFILFASVFLVHNLVSVLLDKHIFESITLRAGILFIGGVLNLLIAKRSVKLSAVLTSLVPVIILYAIPLYFGQNVNEAVVVNTMGFFIACTIPFIIFSIKRNFNTILFLNIVVFVIHIGIQVYKVYYMFPVTSDLVYYFQRNFLLIFLFQVCVWQFLFWLLYSTYQKNERYQGALKEYNRTVHDQKNEIEAQNEELKQQQEQVNSINERLEMLVMERTMKLNDQNAKLIEYAYINSHLLRAPLCRIQGLRNLMNYDPENVEEYQVFLDRSLDELNRVIESISEILQDEDPEILKEIQERLKR